MTDGSNKRAFIVGSGRSGTTLLESLLGAHKAIKGFPESGFFMGVIGQVDQRTRVASDVPLKRKLGRGLTDARVNLGISHKVQAREELVQFLEKVNRPELLESFPENSNSIKTQVDAFIAILDRLTSEDGKEFWIEKTPRHLFYLDEITRYVKPVKIIHIVRNGPDVVASLFDASKVYEGVAWNEFPSLDRCINRWNHSIPITLRSLNKPNHITVCYEQLVEDTPFVLRKLCEFRQTQYDPDMLINYAKASEFVCAGEPWKANTSATITNANSTKFKTLLSEEEQAYVLDRLMKVDYKPFYLD